MGGGGKGGNYSSPMPVYTDPVTGKSFNNADDLNASIAARQQQEADASRQQQEQARQQEALRLQQDLDARNNALSRARSNAVDYIRSRVGDNNIPFDLINNRTQYTYDLTPAGTANPLSAYDPNLGQAILDEVRADNISKKRSQFNNIFKPTYTQDVLPTDFANSYIDTELNNQFNPLATSLENARKRNTLNQQGFDAATNRLNTERTAATSTLRSLADSILGTDRSALQNYITGANNTIDTLGYNEVNSFDPNAYATEANRRAENYKTSFGGDLRNALGNTKFIDLTELLNAGGQAQGATNPGIVPNTSPIGGITDLTADILNNKRRGIGNTGAF